jgi:UDPglucose 6-dehydrogenase
MDIGIIGAGYVGLVTAAGLAATGNHVRVGEADTRKLKQLQAGEVPIYEADLERIVTESMENGLLEFVGDNLEAVSDARVVLLALPTPQADDGSADLRILESALRSLAVGLAPKAVVALKSTVPVGSVAKFQALLDDLGVECTVVSNPEFLREGTAVADFYHPDRIVIGSNDQSATETLVEMYRGIQAPVVVTDPPSAELIKYASNAYLATRITFANALANLCEAVGADISDVLRGMGADRRIGVHFLNPGPGYGGSCFPKDTRALVATANAAGYDFSLLRSVIAVNELQLVRVISKVEAAVSQLSGARIGIWGLAFKAGTDDIRESPGAKLADALVERGALVTAYDPAVDGVANPDVAVVDNPIEAVRDADALVVATEWSQFKAVDLRLVRDEMAGDVIVDLRNLLDPILVTQVGMTYVGIGRAGRPTQSTDPTP